MYMKIEFLKGFLFLFLLHRRHIPLYTANVRIGHRTGLHMTNFELLEVSVLLLLPLLLLCGANRMRTMSHATG